MKEFQLQDAIGQLPEELLAPVDRLRSRRVRPWLPAAVAVACICLLLSLPAGMGAMMRAGSKADDGAPMEYMNEMADGVHTNMEPLYSGSTASARFLATVVSVESWGILVEPLEDEWESQSADRIEVSFENISDPPRLEPGDLVRVTYGGTLLESYPARAVDVTGVSRLG